jgi:Sulfotransferase family
LTVVNGSAGRLPDFFIVGHPKSGTTALYSMLRRHPQIYMPALKEPLFFSGEVGDPRLRQAQNLPRTLEEYVALFDGAKPEQRIGEASPSYLKSHVAARRIAELQPDARIIAILREPASFLRSLHLELLRDHVETETDMRRAIALEERRRKENESSQIQMGLRYSPEHVRYVEQLRRYHDVFPPERVLVLVYDDFRADNEGTVRRALRFLEVDDTVPIEVVEARPAVRVRSPRLYGLVQSLYLGRGGAARTVKTAIKAVTPRQLRRNGLALLERRVLFGKPAAPDEQLMLELRRRSKGDVVALSEYLNRDFVTLWGYEGIE